MIGAGRASLGGSRPRFVAKRENSNVASVAPFTCVVPDAGDGAAAGMLAVAFFGHQAGNLTTPSGWDPLRGQPVATDGSRFAALQMYVKKLVGADLGSTITVPNSGTSPYLAAILVYAPVAGATSPWSSQGINPNPSTGEVSTINFETVGANNRRMRVVSGVVATDPGNNAPTITPSPASAVIRSNQTLTPSGFGEKMRLTIFDDDLALSAVRSAALSATSLAAETHVGVLG